MPLYWTQLQYIYFASWQYYDISRGLKTKQRTTLSRSHGCALLWMAMFISSFRIRYSSLTGYSIYIISLVLTNTVETEVPHSELTIIVPALLYLFISLVRLYYDISYEHFNFHFYETKC